MEIGITSSIRMPETSCYLYLLPPPKRHDVPLGRPAGTAEQVQQRMKEGFLFFQAGSELGMMAAGASTLLKPLWKTGFDLKARPLY